MKKLVPLLLLVLVVVFAAGCDLAGITITPSTQPPTINSFGASPPTIDAGESSTLSWNVVGATMVSIDQGIGNVALAGSRIVAPSATTVYTLTATGASGISATATAQVIVSGAPSPPASLPVVNSFTASPPNITVGEIATLSWNVSNATSVTIDHGVGNFSSSGNTLVSPATTTTYILTAANAAGSTTATTQVIVSVAPSPPAGLPVVNHFTADPPIISAGSSTTLSWSVSNATAVTIDPGVGPVGSVGTAIVSPATNTNYTLTAANAYGLSSLTIGVLVTAAPPVPVEHTVTLFSVAADDGHVKQGGGTNPYPNVGDNTANEALQAFLSFNISGIPTGAVIKSASLDLTTGDVLGDPFAGLGWMRVYNDQYGNLGNEDFTPGFPTGAIYTYSSKPVTPFTSTGLVNALQTQVNAGAPRFQVRLQFQNYTDGDNVVDALRLGEGKPKLVVTYEE
jgi:hypothetical protein